MSQDAGKGAGGWRVFFRKIFGRGAASGGDSSNAAIAPVAEDPEELARRRIRQRMENIESRISGTLNTKKRAEALDLDDFPQAPGEGDGFEPGGTGIAPSAEAAESAEAAKSGGSGQDPGQDADQDDGLLFLGPEEAAAPADVDAPLSRFAAVDLEHPVMAALFRLGMRRRARKALIDDGPDFDAPLEFLVADVPIPEAKGPVPRPEELVRADVRLASMPGVYARLNEALKSGQCRVPEAAAIIGMDPGLSATLLKMVNSAFYGRAMRQTAGRFPVQVDSLSRAVTVIGENQLSNLALSVSVLPLFQNLPRELVDVRAMWRHSLGTAILARILARRAGLPDPERAFLAGLLHDIGRLAAYRGMPGHCVRALALSVGEKISLTQAERRLFGWDHAELGGTLLEKWRYPASLAAAVAGHHDPEAILSDMETAAIHLADMAAIALEYGHSGDRRVPVAVPGAVELLGLTPEGLDETVQEAEIAFEAVFASMSVGDEDAVRT